MLRLAKAVRVFSRHIVRSMRSHPFNLLVDVLDVIDICLNTGLFNSLVVFVTVIEQIHFLLQLVVQDVDKVQDLDYDKTIAEEVQSEEENKVVDYHQHRPTAFLILQEHNYRIEPPGQGCELCKNQLNEVDK